MQAKEQYIRYLEDLRDWYVKALNFGAGIDDFPISMALADGEEFMLHQAQLRIGQVFQFDVSSFWTVDNSNNEFKLSLCVPGDEQEEIQRQVEYHIEKGTFSWAINQSRAVLVKTENKRRSMLFHVLATRQRVRGMYVAILDERNLEVKDSAFNLLSMILASTANAVESCELYRVLQQQNRDLEELVDKRTMQLNSARLQAEAANKAKSDFLANMSHDLRTPLAAVLGYAQSILHSKSGSDIQRYASIIKKTTDHLLKLINDILDLSKVESNQLEISNEAVQLLDLVDDVYTMVLKTAENKGIRFDCHYDFPLPNVVFSDSTRLKQILINVCGNAVKFTEQGQVTLTVLYIQDQNKLVFLVEDTGMGISEEQQKRLFQRFAQADDSISIRYGGSGLGLMISRQIAEKMQGSVTLEQSSPSGSLFKICVSVDLPSDVEFVYSQKSQSLEVGGDEERLFKAKVLLAEDNEDLTALMRVYLQDTGIELDHVGNGKLVLEQVRENRYDLILMDMQMPQMDGKTAVEKLRQSGLNTPIVALSADILPDHVDSFLEVGCNEFLSKPVQKGQLLKVLSQYLVSRPVQTLSKSNEVKEHLAILQKTFASTLPERLSKMGACLQDSDWEALATMVHNLKGVAGAMGYGEISEISSAMQINLAQASYDPLEPLLRAMEVISRKAA